MTTESRKRFALGGAATTLALAGATVALATPPNGETLTPLARGSLVQPANLDVNLAGGRVRIKTQGAIDALTAQPTLAPGGTSGWHKDAGPLVVIVKQGTLTIIDGKCKRHDLPAGHANIDSGGSVHKTENRGSTPVVYYVTLLVPHNVTSPDTDEPAPAGCTA
jgi:quercetin dioxygenase-like cupin family protein